MITFKNFGMALFGSQSGPALKASAILILFVGVSKIGVKAEDVV